MNQQDLDKLKALCADASVAEHYYEHQAIAMQILGNVPALIAQIETLNSDWNREHEFAVQMETEVLRLSARIEYIQAALDKSNHWIELYKHMTDKRDVRIEKLEAVVDATKPFTQHSKSSKVEEVQALREALLALEEKE